jgi:hypothetical protein
VIGCVPEPKLAVSPRVAAPPAAKVLPVTVPPVEVMLPTVPSAAAALPSGPKAMVAEPSAVPSPCAMETDQVLFAPATGVQDRLSVCARPSESITGICVAIAVPSGEAGRLAASFALAVGCGL